MADGVAITAGSGTTIATDDTGSGHIQIVRLAHGPDGALDFDGLDMFRSIDLDETEEDVKASAGLVYGYYLWNGATSTRFVKFYNAAAASVTVGTTTPVLTIPVPALSAANVAFTLGIKFSTAICVAATTGVADADTGAPAANDVVANIFYA